MAFYNQSFENLCHLLSSIAHIKNISYCGYIFNSNIKYVLKQQNNATNTQKSRKIPT
jgi:hypothetical protein